jgi:hypothetical protein
LSCTANGADQTRSSVGAGLLANAIHHPSPMELTRFVMHCNGPEQPHPSI